MSIESDLAKEGIKIIKPLDALMVNSIAKNVAEKLVSTFPEQNLDYDKLFIAFSRLPMYYVQMPNGTTFAKYYHRNSSIYFSNNIAPNELINFAIHELIHFIQENRDKNNNLLRLGLCDFTHPKLVGMALNEAAVQLMTSKILNLKQDKVKYFGITIPTTSPDYYPLECNLVNQLAYIVGEDILFNSTLNGNLVFETTLTTLTSKKSFKQIRDNLDIIMILEDKLSYLSYILENNELGKKKEKFEIKIEKIKNRVTNIFIETQNLILSSYFDLYFNELYSIKGIENFRNKLYSYQRYIGTTDNYSFYSNYYISKMADLEKKRTEFKNNSIALIPVKNNPIVSLFKKIAQMLHLQKSFSKE